MNAISLLQLVVSGGLATGFLVFVFHAGRIVETITSIDRCLSKIEDRVRGIEIELKDVQTKVTVLWEQRNVI